MLANKSEGLTISWKGSFTRNKVNATKVEHFLDFIFDSGLLQDVSLKTGIHSMPGWTATTRHGVTRKRSTKRLKHTGNLFRKNIEFIGVCYF